MSVVPLRSNSRPDPEVRYLAFDKIEQNPFRDLINNPLQPDQVANLTAAILSTEFWQHLPVRPHPEMRGYYQLAFGHGRLEAAKATGLTGAFFLISDYDNETMLRMQTDENITQFGKDRFATYKEATVNAAEWIMAAVVENPKREHKFMPPDPGNASQVLATIIAGGCPGEDVIAKFYNGTLNVNSIRAALKVYHDTGELTAWHKKHNPKAAKMVEPTLDPEALKKFTKTDHVRTFVKAVQETNTPVALQVEVAEKLIKELGPEPKRTRGGREAFQNDTPDDYRFNSKNIRNRVIVAAQERTRSPKRKAELERIEQMSSLERALIGLDTGLTRTLSGCRLIVKLMDALGNFTATDMTVLARHHLTHAAQSMAEFERYVATRQFKKMLRIMEEKR